MGRMLLRSRLSTVQGNHISHCKSLPLAVACTELSPAPALPEAPRIQPRLRGDAPLAFPAFLPTLALHRDSRNPELSPTASAAVPTARAARQDRDSPLPPGPGFRGAGGYVGDVHIPLSVSPTQTHAAGNLCWGFVALSTPIYSIHSTFHAEHPPGDGHAVNILSSINTQPQPPCQPHITHSTEQPIHPDAEGTGQLMFCYLRLQTQLSDSSEPLSTCG